MRIGSTGDEGQIICNKRNSEESNWVGGEAAKKVFTSLVPPVSFQYRPLIRERKQ